MHNCCQTLGIKRFAGSDSFAQLRLQHKENRQLIHSSADGIQSLVIFHCPLDG